MKKILASITAMIIVVSLAPTSVFGFQSSAGARQENAAGDEAPAAEAAKPTDNTVTTKHTATIKGKKIAYTAETGTMVLESCGEQCEIFYTAYTKDGVKDKSTRPITFAYNGGPGAASSYIHFGCLGPRRVELDEKGVPITLPAKVVDNQNSILDITDLVFIDPVGTGYSRAVDESKADVYYNYDSDNECVGDFIRQYVNRNNRWGSPKYLAGESYGTTRSVGVCNYLANNCSMNVNGLMLISCVNDFSAIAFGGSNELPYASFIPTYAAAAWYHGVLSQKYQDMKLEDYMDEVCSFVEKEYVPALFMGTKLSKSELESTAEKLADYIGVSKEFVIENNLRFDLEPFSKEILKDKKLMIGRYDERLTGPSTTGSIYDGKSDPSGSTVDTAFGDAFRKYITEELGYQTDRNYITLSLDINNAWSFPINNIGGYLAQEDTIRDILSKNKFLKIWVLSGYYDAATPFYGTQWQYNHVFANDDVKERITFTHYASGHMLYIDSNSFDQFREDAEKWYGVK